MSAAMPAREPLKPYRCLNGVERQQLKAAWLAAPTWMERLAVADRFDIAIQTAYRLAREGWRKPRRRGPKPGSPIAFATTAKARAAKAAAKCGGRIRPGVAHHCGRGM